MKKWLLIFLISLSLPNLLGADNKIGFLGMEMYKFDYGIEQLQSTDINNDGLNDLVIVNNRKAKIELLINKGANRKDEKFDDKEVIDNINVINYDSRFKVETIPVTSRVGALRFIDVNGDKKKDLVFLGNPGGLFVFLQGEDLSFKKERNVDIEGLITVQYGLHCLDLDGSGAPFFLILTKDAIHVYDYREDPALANPEKLPLEEGFIKSVQDIFIQDFNGDGKADIIFAVPFSKQSLWVKFQTEKGGFGPFYAFEIDKYRSLKLHDMDGNGRPEIFHIQSVSGRVIISEFKNLSADDTGTALFRAPVMYPYPSAEAKERDLTIGDINGDKLTDILITEPKISAISAFIQNPFTAFNRFKIYPSLVKAEEIFIRDVGPAAGNEIVIFSKEENIIGVSRFQKEGRISFPEPLTVRGEVTATIVTDINADGINDLVYATTIKKPRKTRLLEVLYGQKEGGFAKKGLEIKPAKALKADPEHLLVFDVDGNGRKDIIVFVAFEKFFRIFTQDEKGGFKDITAEKTFNTGIIEDVKANNFAVSDIDNDGKAEFFITRNNFARLLTIQDNQVKILEQINSPLNGSVKTVVPINIDNKGANELLLYDSSFSKLLIMQKDAEGSFAPIETISLDDIAIEDIRVADLDNDERQDIMLVGKKKFGVLFRGKSKHALTMVGSYETKIKDGHYGYLRAGDFNADLITEVVLVESSNHMIEFLSATRDEIKHVVKFKVFETGPGQEQASFDNRRGKTRYEPRDIVFEDVNQDNLPDMIAVVHDRLIIYLQEK